MSAFPNDTDARMFLVRTLFNRELGREPTAAEQTARVAQIPAQGADLVLAQIRDSPEAQAFRAKRGW